MLDKQTLSTGDRPAAMPSADAAGLTPAMRQFIEAKAEHPDCLLLYRMGDFYELFFEDAEIAAAALNITLTKRGKIDGRDIPMCGVPFHAAENYLTRLIKQGHRVAICEQAETPDEARMRKAKGPLKRHVVRIITPGTLVEDGFLPPRENNFLTAVFVGADRLAVASADLSTGELAVESPGLGRLGDALARLAPAEIIISENQLELENELSEWDTCLSRRPARDFDPGVSRQKLESMYQVATLDGMAALERTELAALGGLIRYLEETQKGKPIHLKPLRSITDDTFLAIDPATRKSLELTRTQTGERRGSLLAAIDKTVTAAGGRLLASRLAMPLKSKEPIVRRLDLVEVMLGDAALAERVLAALKSMPDLERSLSRLGLDQGGPRDLATIASGIGAASRCAEAVKGRATLGLADDQLEALAEALSAGGELAAMMTEALADDLPLLARDGGFIRRGVDTVLDELFTLRDESKRLIAALERDYVNETGITGLKIKHNNVLGYHIEVKSNHADKLMNDPEKGFIHRQTTAQAVRFSTVKLAELEKAMSEAASQAIEKEIMWFDQLKSAVMEQRAMVMALADAAAQLDVTTAMALLAEQWRYCRPSIGEDGALEIIEGRHPVVEQMLVAGHEQPFVVNSCRFDDHDRIWLLTGPNMAGKSTFLRQNALITIMAHAGFYVPAASAAIGLVDRVFCRVGASDDLASGRSTFMVEMVETAAILNRSTDRSLVILDEVGRGTATFDGLSLAWAVVEHLHDVTGARVLFATHYHELAALEKRLDALSCHVMKVREWKGKIVFLHEVDRGAADRSYGIHVARLAGVPASVIGRAEQVLAALSDEKSTGQKIEDLPLFDPLAVSASAPEPSAVEKALSALSLDHLTPREALDRLYALKSMLDDEGEK